MHPNSLQLMRYFRRTFVSDVVETRLLDVGSMEVATRMDWFGMPRSYRGVWKGVKEYIGVDLAAGPGVDMVLGQPDAYPFFDNYFDVVISGQTLEHTERPWHTVPDMARVLRPGGLICLIAPWRFKIHRYPVDCWRILPDGMVRLLRDAKLDVLECYTSHNDTIGIGRKG